MIDMAKIPDESGMRAHIAKTHCLLRQESVAQKFVFFYVEKSTSHNHSSVSGRETRRQGDLR